MASFEKVIRRVEEAKTSTNNPMWKIHTDDEKPTNCFDSDMADIAKDHIDCKANFHMEKNDKGYWNLTGIEPLEATAPQTTTSVKQDDPNLSYQQSYGRDIYIALINAQIIKDPDGKKAGAWVADFVTALNADKVINSALDDDMPEGWDK